MKPGWRHLNIYGLHVKKKKRDVFGSESLVLRKSVTLSLERRRREKRRRVAVVIGVISSCKKKAREKEEIVAGCTILHSPIKVTAYYKENQKKERKQERERKSLCDTEVSFHYG